MSRKGDLKRAILDSEREIEALEKKRERSQSALLNAIMTQQKLNATDVQYFRTFTALIDNERKNLRALTDELNGLKNKK